MGWDVKSDQFEDITSFLLHSGKDGIGPERLEDLVAPSHVKPKLTGQNRTRVELPLRDLLLDLV